MNRTAQEILVRPVVTEESSRLQFEENKYTFEVIPSATKPEIREVVEDYFEVQVTGVRTMNVPGKPRGRRANMQEGRSRSWKKAIVGLVEGDTIDVFGGAA